MTVEPEAMVEGLVMAPLGATLLRVLEVRYGGVPSSSLPFSSPPPVARAVEAAARAVAELPADDVVAAVLEASSTSNPWSGTPEEVTEDLEAAPRRRLIAEALVDHHAAFLTAPLDRTAQVAWLAHDSTGPTIGDLDHVYECGEFPWGGQRTHTALRARHNERLWDVFDIAQPDPIAVWELSVRPDARVFEVNSPADWLELVRRHTRHVNPFRSERRGLRRVALSAHNAWDIQLRSIDADGTATVDLIDGRVIRGVRGLVMPDWSSIAREADAVHLSWLGFLLAEGQVVNAGEGWLAVARFWPCERAVFLADVFDRAERVGAVGPPWP